MKDVLKEQRNQKYNDYVKRVTPVHSLPLNMLKAFVTGGVICVIGQAILNYGDMLGLEKDIAASWCSLILIFVSVIRNLQSSAEQERWCRSLDLPIRWQLLRSNIRKKGRFSGSDARSLRLQDL